MRRTNDSPAGDRTETSPCYLIVVVCPGCGTRYDDWHRPSINAQLDPALDTPEYLAAASTATCPRCRHTVQLHTLVVRVEGDEEVWTHA